MALEIILISVSCLLVVALFVHKWRELHRGISIPHITTVRARVDTHVRDATRRAEEVASSVTAKNAVIAGNRLVVFIARLFLRISSYVHNLFHRLVEHGVRREERLTERKAASFYLKQISESRNGRQKDTGESGEIH